MKIDRISVFKKCDGHCAYCGGVITLKNFQVDHVNPKFLGGGNDQTNLLPSCRKCNNFKTAMTLDTFRRQLGLQVSRLKNNAQFDRALRFAQVKITNEPIVFYFERDDEKTAKEQYV